MFRKTKYHAVFKRIGESWSIETLELYGKDVDKLESQITSTLTNLENQLPIDIIYFNKHNSLHRPLKENETRSERVLEEIKTNKHQRRNQIE